MLKRQFGIKNSIERGIHAFRLNQKTARMCAKVLKVELGTINASYISSFLCLPLPLAVRKADSTISQIVK